jgi:hypothetical protein
MKIAILRYITILLILFFSANIYAQSNTIRAVRLPAIAKLTGVTNSERIPALFLKRAKDAGYTHIIYPVAIRAGEWGKGKYQAGDTGEEYKALKDAFIKVNKAGLFLIPELPSANRHSALAWLNADNSDIYYQPIANDLLAGQAKSDILDDDVLIFFQFSDLLGTNSEDVETQEISVSTRTSGNGVEAVPSWAPTPEGFAKSYKSLLGDLIARAFKDTQLSEDKFEYIHIGYDEPYLFNALVTRENKLLIGKSQDDLKYMYDINPDGSGVIRVPRAGNPSIDEKALNLAALSDADNRRLRVYDDWYYEYESGDEYQAAVNDLIAQHIADRMSQVSSLLPNVAVIMHADIFDPQHNGGYFETSGALPLLSAKFDLLGLERKKLLLMPWSYQTTHQHDAEGTLGQVNVDGVKELVVTTVKKLSAPWIACGVTFPRLSPPFLPDPNRIPRAICRAVTAKYVIERTVEEKLEDIHLDAVVNFDARGQHYDASKAIKHFTDHDFSFLYIHAFADGIHPHTLSQTFNIANAVSNLPQDLKTDYVQGFATAVWVEPWDTSRTIYDQVPEFNVMEVAANAYTSSKHAGPSALFGHLQAIPDLGLAADKQLVSVLDYFSTNKTVFDSRFFETINSPRNYVAFYDAIWYCNLLSERDNLDPVYEFDRIDFNKFFGKLSTSNMYHPLIDDMLGLTADLSRNGYRLPTRAELQQINTNPDIVKGQAPLLGEYVWIDGRPDSAFQYADEQIVSTGMPPFGPRTSEGEFVSFRVVRNWLNGDIDFSNDVDRDDLALLLDNRNKSVSTSNCGEACDLDGDGLITVLDARKLLLSCTRPRCATDD